MYDSDCILLMSELKRPLLQILKVSEPAGLSYFSWDKDNDKVILVSSSKRRFVRASVIIHAAYAILQFYFIVKSQGSISGKLIGSSIMAITILLLTCRWEFNVDENPMQVINGLLVQKLETNHMLKGKFLMKVRWRNSHL